MVKYKLLIIIDNLKYKINDINKYYKPYINTLRYTTTTTTTNYTNFIINNKISINFKFSNNIYYSTKFKYSLSNNNFKQFKQMNNSNISNNNSITQNNITYLDSKLSAKLDEELMQNLGFTSQQLMEMAGISIADAIYNKTINEWKGLNNIIVISGPGSKYFDYNNS